MIFTYILIGLLSGIFTGSIGIGSGIIMVPLLNILGMTLYNAVATSLFIQLVPQSIFGVIEYYKKGHIRWKETLFVLIGSFIGIYIGSIIVNKNIIPIKILYIILSIILLISSIYIFYKHILQK